MSRPFGLKISITVAAALVGAVINLFPVSLFFGANFVLGGIIAQAPAILFGPAWGALSMGMATLPTVAYWRDPFFPFLMALSALAVGYWLRRFRSRVVEGALFTGLCVIAPTAGPVYLHIWDLPTSGVAVITAKVIVNFMAEVVACSQLLSRTGLEARLTSRVGTAWDMRAHLANGLSLVVFLSLGGATVFFGNAEYRRVQSQAVADVRLFTEGVRHDLIRWVSDRQRTLAALAATLPIQPDPAALQGQLAAFRTVHPELIQVEVVADGRSSPAGSPAGYSGRSMPVLRISTPLPGDPGAAPRFLAADVSLTFWEPAVTNTAHGLFLVLDPGGRVVVGPPRWPPGTIWQITDLGLPQPGFGDVIPVLPDTQENSLVQWQDGQLVYTETDPAFGWKVTGLLPLATYQNRLFTGYQTILFAGIGLMIPFLLVIHGVSRQLTRPVEQVAATAKARLLGNTQVEWPAPGPVAEVNALTLHLRAAEEALADAQRHLASRNQELEAANRNLEHLAATDSLTGLRNRRTLDTILDQELKRARRGVRSGALLLIDVDDFKVVNDTYGHPAGDAALSTLARTVESTMRESDLAARYGGDEFAAVLFDLARAEALETTERIRATIQAAPIPVPGGTVCLTVSIGLAMYPADGDTLPRLMAAADRALYASKADSRNR